MGNIFMGLNIGRSALLTQQAGLDVTGHNLANVQTEGYSRQRVDVVQSLPLQTYKGPMGSGVDVARIQRLQLTYVERQLQQATSRNSYDSALVSGVAQLQTELGEPSSTGLGTALTEFWSSFEALSARPADNALRMQVLDRAEHLATVYNQRIEALTTLEGRFGDRMADGVSEVNALSEKIASLNREIGQAENSGYVANDLRDQRDLLVRQIAEKIEVTTETDGSYLSVRLAGDGAHLVNRLQSFDLATELDGEGKVVGLTMGEADLVPQGGELGASYQLLTSTSPKLRGDLARLMGTVSDAVNRTHASGFDLLGRPGRNLFSWEGGTELQTFARSEGISSVSANALVQAGTHHLTVASVSDTLVSGGGSTVPTSAGRTLGLTATAVEPGQYGGPMAVGLDYHLRVVAAGSASGSLDGVQVQLFRGDEAAGEVRDASAGSATWTVDGLTFTAAIGAGPGEVFAAGERSDGLFTVGTVSLDGGPAQALDLTAASTASFTGGSSYGHAAGGTATVRFAAGPFLGASFTRYSAEGKLGVDPVVAVDPERVAAGVEPSGEGSENARRLGDLAASGIFEDSGETSAAFLGRIVQTLGSEGRDAQVFEEASGSIVTQLEAQRQSVSGVSTDEEMVQLIQYQRGFEAAARFLTMVDSLIDTLINRVGLGGR